jgi:hypothetical protein
MVASVTPRSAAQDPAQVDLAFYAKLALRVRSEMIKPIG